MQKAQRFLIAVTVALVLLFLGYVPGESKIYKYVDENGKVHFTNNASNIPLRYRNKKDVEEIPGLPGSTPKTQELGESTGSDSGSSVTPEAGKKEGEAEPVGLSEEDEQLMGESKTVLQTIVKLGESYKGVRANFTAGRRLLIEIQGNLPAKEGLAQKTSKSKEPVLQEVGAFLTQSIAQDKQSKALKLGLKTRITAIFNRVMGDGERAASLITKIDQAIEESGKEKAEAENKAKQEAQKTSEK